MLAAAIIVSREMLEASLIVGIVLAATKGIVGRGLWVGGGIVGGLLLAGIVAAGAEGIAAAIAGIGQELFNALALLAAVLLLGGHNIWMGRPARAPAAQAANFLVRADLLPPVGRRIWDTSWLLPQDSPIGQLLHTLIGYVDRPSGLQLIAYVATLAMIGGAMRFWGRSQPAVAAAPAA